MQKGDIARIDNCTTEPFGPMTDVDLRYVPPPEVIRRANQTQVGFVHKGRRLERLPGRLAGHPLRRELAQFFVHKG